MILVINNFLLPIASTVLLFNPFSLLIEIISMILVLLYYGLLVIQLVSISIVIFCKFLHPNLKWFIHIFKIFNKMKWLILIIWIIYKISTGLYFEINGDDWIYFCDFFVVLVYCRECSKLIVRRNSSPIWNGMKIANSVEERAGGYIVRNPFRIVVSMKEFNIEFVLVLFVYNVSILFLIARDGYLFFLFTGTDFYALIKCFIRFVKNIPVNPHSKYQLLETVILFKRPWIKEYAIVLKINSIKLDVDIDAMNTNDKKERNKELMSTLYEYFCYKWYFLVVQARYQLSFHILIQDDSYELYIILKRKSFFRDSGKMISLINEDASTIQASISTDLNYQLKAVRGEELESIFQKLGIILSPEQTVTRVKNESKFQNTLNRETFSYFGMNSTLIKFNLQDIVRSFPNQKYRITNCMDQFLKSLIDNKIKAHFFFNFQAASIDKIEADELLHESYNDVLQVNEKKIRNFEYLINDARISAGLFIFSSGDDGHTNSVARARGIIQNTWEIKTSLEKSLLEFKRTLTTEKIDSFMYHVPSFILFKFFHFPSLISRHQERIYEIHLQNPPDSVIKAGSLNIGKIIDIHGPSNDFLLSLDDLKRHVLVSGTTGSGKSTFIQNLIEQILIHFPTIPLLIIELKGEYNWMEKKYPNVKFYEPGKNLGVNLFETIGNPQIHAERVFDMMKSSFDFSELKDFSPQMEKVLIDIISLTCSNAEPSRRNFSTFFANAQKYINENKSRIPFLDSTWIGIENRIRRIASGPLSNVFDNKELQHDFDRVFKTLSIISLGNIVNLGGSKEDLSFFSNLILKQLWDINIASGPSKNINHITIIDDSQYFNKTQQETRSKSTNYFEDIALLLRGTGEVLIAVSTRPDISADVLSNCGLIVCFQTKFKEDIQKLQSMLHLTESQVSLLEILPEHTSIVKCNSYPYPFMIETRKPLSWEHQADLNENHLLTKNKLKNLEKEIPKTKKKNLIKNRFGNIWISDLLAGFDPSSYEMARIFLDKTEEYYRLNEECWINLQVNSVSNFDALNERCKILREELLTLIKTNTSVRYLVNIAEKIIPKNLSLYKLKFEIQNLLDE